MSISNQNLTTVINCIDDINRINELQELLQAVVDIPDVKNPKFNTRVQIMSELYLHQVSPLLQKLTRDLSLIQMYFMQEKSR